MKQQIFNPAQTTDLFGVEILPPKPHFNGSDYKPELDDKRLLTQFEKILNLMKDEKFRTLSEIRRITGIPESSASAQLRHAKKPRFGGHTLNKKPKGDRKNGLWQYQLILNKEQIKCQ